MKTLLMSFVSKKMLAKIAIEILRGLVKSTDTTLDDKAAAPVIQAIKDYYGIK